MDSDEIFYQFGDLLEKREMYIRGTRKPYLLEIWNAKNQRSCVGVEIFWLYTNEMCYTFADSTQVMK